METPSICYQIRYGERNSSDPPPPCVRGHLARENAKHGKLFFRLHAVQLLPAGGTLPFGDSSFLHLCMRDDDKVKVQRWFVDENNNSISMSQINRDALLYFVFLQTAVILCLLFFRSRIFVLYLFEKWHSLEGSHRKFLHVRICMEKYTPRHIKCRTCHFASLRSKNAPIVICVRLHKVHRNLNSNTS